MCDEPTGALDYKTSKEILKLIEDVNKKYGNTVILVTHNDAIKNMADRVIKLRDGQIRHDIVNTKKLRHKSLTGRRCVMRNPLTKRIPREIKNDLGKYIALFLFLILSIGFISGFLVAGDSMKSAFDNSLKSIMLRTVTFVLPQKLTTKQKKMLKISA